MDLFFKLEDRFRGFLIRQADFLIIGVICILSLGIRYKLLHFQSADMEHHLLRWVSIFETEGFNAFSRRFSDYNNAYLYFIYLISLFSIDSITVKIGLIKSLSIVFDFLIAFLIYKILKYNDISKGGCYLGAGIALLLPTVFLNSSAWGQCDSIYSFFCLLCIYHLQKEHYYRSLTAYSLGFIFKLQSIFLFPYLFFLWMKRNNLRFHHFLIIPLSLFIVGIPAWLLSDAQFWVIYDTYFRQASAPGPVVSSAPAFYRFLESGLMIKPGVFLAMGIIFILIYLKLKQRGSGELYETALLFVLMTIYFLPKMHERYFYFAELLALVYVFIKPNLRSAFILIWLQVSACITYSKFLFNVNIPNFTFQVLSGGFILIIGLLLYENIYKSQNLSSSK